MRILTSQTCLFAIYCLLTLSLYATPSKAHNPPSEAPNSRVATARWKAVESLVNSSLRGVSVVDAQTVWISGAEGTVLRSTDGGKTFDRLKVPDADEVDFRDVHGFDAMHCSLMVAGQPARFYFTSDGGQNWSIAYEHPDDAAFFNAMEFWDERHGVAFSDPIDGRLLVVTTQDGGRSWQPLAHDKRPVVAPDEHGYAASGTCLAVLGENQVWIGLGGHFDEDRSTIARIVFSRDRGQTWSSADSALEGSASAGVFSLVFNQEGRGVAVGGDYLQPKENDSVLAITGNGGRSWKVPANHGLRGFRSCVGWVRLNSKWTLVACGPSGCDYSVDGGQTWKPLGDTGYHALSFSSDGNTGWAVGGEGRIAKWTMDR